MWRDKDEKGPWELAFNIAWSVSHPNEGDEEKSDPDNDVVEGAFVDVTGVIPGTFRVLPTDWELALQDSARPGPPQLPAQTPLRDMLPKADWIKGGS